jgi:ribonucleoside-triphosphate reductase
LEDGTFETWEQTIDRVVMHQRWLWERALGDQPLNDDQLAELEELRALMLDRKAAVSGRTMWLGGTEIARRREASQFNCAFTQTENVVSIRRGPPCSPDTGVRP